MASFLLILVSIFEPGPPVSSYLKRMDHKRFQQREHATESIRSFMYQDGKYNYKIMLQMKWVLLTYPLSHEVRRRLSDAVNNVWKKYLDIKPTHYWKFPWIGKKECPDIYKNTPLLTEAQKLSAHEYNVQHEYPLYRAAGKVYARNMLLSTKMTRQEVQRMVDRWVIEEMRWFLDNNSHYLLKQMKERMK